MCIQALGRRLGFWGSLTCVVFLAAGCAAEHAKLSEGSRSSSSSYFVKRAGHDSVIIFIHGLMGNAHETWHSEKSGAHWPNLIKEDPDLQKFDIYSVGYHSPALGHGSSIPEIANRVRQELIDREFFVQYKQIYLVAHSMGGLIGKRLVSSLNTPVDQVRLERIRAVIFLSTPSKGSDLANMLKVVSRNPQVADVNAGHSILRLLGNDFRAVLAGRAKRSSPFPKSFCAYETLPTFGVQVVPDLYSEDQCDEEPVAFDFNHLEIAKPESRDHEPYVWVKARLLEASTSQPTSGVISLSPKLNGNAHQEELRTQLNYLNSSTGRHRFRAYKSGRLSLEWVGPDFKATGKLEGSDRAETATILTQSQNVVDLLLNLKTAGYHVEILAHAEGLGIPSRGDSGSNQPYGQCIAAFFDAFRNLGELFSDPDIRPIADSIISVSSFRRNNISIISEKFIENYVTTEDRMNIWFGITPLIVRNYELKFPKDGEVMKQTFNRIDDEFRGTGREGNGHVRLARVHETPDGSCQIELEDGIDPFEFPQVAKRATPNSSTSE